MGYLTKHSLLLLSLLASFALAGCAEPEDTPPEQEPEDTEQQQIVDYSEDTCDDNSGERHVYLVRTMAVARETETGVARGFDLDDAVSENGGSTGCGRPDFTSPDGEEGIDNQFARLLPTIESVGGAAFETLVQNAINEGDLLILIELTDVDSLENDGCVGLDVMYGVGTPYLSTDSYVEPWQTYDIDINRPHSSVDEVAIRGGRLEAGPLLFQIPFAVFDFIFPVDLLDARIQLDFDAKERTGSGLISGAITVENMLDIANGIEGGEQFPPLIDRIGRRMADLQPDDEKKCQALSTAMTIDVIGAFIYPDSERFE